MNSTKRTFRAVRGRYAGKPIIASFFGTVTRADGLGRVLYEADAGAAVRLRGMDAFAALARAAGWRVARVQDSSLSHDVVLVKNEGRPRQI